MPRQHGPWAIDERREVYRNAFVTLREDRVRQPDGQPGTYATLVVPHGVAVLPIDRDGTAHLVRQFRYAVGRESIEAVSGGIAPGEEPDAAARREVKEELGVEAGEWRTLGLIDPDTAIVCGPVRLYLARELTFGRPEREGTEALAVVKVPLGEAVRMALASEITHGPSVALILRAGHALHVAP